MDCFVRTACGSGRVKLEIHNSRRIPIYQGLALESSIFVLKRSNGNWSAVVIRNIAADSKKYLPAKRLETKLEEPKSGWENVWEKLVAEEILTLPNGVEVGVLPCPDCWSYEVESKVGESYNFYHYDEGGYKIREARQMSKIANIIADEFNLQDLKADDFGQ